MVSKDNRGVVKDAIALQEKSFHPSSTAEGYFPLKE